MPTQICSTNDSTCELCRVGRPRPHQYKKWVAQTDWAMTAEKEPEEIKVFEENLPF